ncbi:MAG TPA: hypothetical protein V6D02_01675, partial [Candidatus Obscuribacterales bacterium]
GFHLLDGEYEPLEPNEQGWLWSKQLGLHLGIHENVLRFFTPEGKLVPTPEERNEKLAAKLRELGVDPETVE